jgi:hypothetical protein
MAVSMVVEIFVTAAPRARSRAGCRMRRLQTAPKESATMLSYQP